ncbi:ATPase, histidine kinase-, DNA gyrase B-, and HSP90-like domain protein [Leptolyngbya boryana NIES-2135]|uniref:histidine kinase n=1 Tax=Leptolyngbya boryana NIES-2135 TaxID=1973484 RepID=A0A1Z4JBY2_LEPBY|nr:PAS domain-containing sensor histidine kinase [Leptolyngbya boryana]MBD2370266.1 PAS domain-containing protein [Leptolyngbya sp. FACHB-161]MBD2376630.1 PAS domain-containing protein [Leptolyngbya sp. FACHB-238]MBD2400902.1 PAS domain-containing protein [Leptolyngbya sp. FACHB-239]MBD2407528.1 PAS domain-containing protein [Leptolyngbya sp. FACHB-402]BAY54203.1 ATPase, histidine kinase-, DNA gyrase B-, and HSP90-like domain protein [Leptolyngbya boryana NIES-2135]
MSVFWFLAGLAIGILPLTIYRSHLSSRIDQLAKTLPPDEASVDLSIMSRLSMRLAHDQAQTEKLERKLEVWKQILYLAPIGYLQVDEENQLIWCNSAAVQLLGINQGDDYAPRLLLELVRSYELDALIEKAREKGQPHQREWRFYPASADAENLSQARSTPLRGLAFPLQGGEVGVFLEDRQEAVTLSQQRDRWTSDVAHELKTPLTSIRLVAETLQSRIDPPNRQWVDRLLNETLRLSRLVQDLLDLSQLDLNPAQRLKLKQTDLVTLINAAWQSLEPIASEKQVQFYYSGLASVIVRADEARMHRVFLNLLDNSLKYSPNKGIIRIETSVNDQSVSPQIQVDLVDAGAGFPEDAIPHIFERFYRADPSRVRSTQGREAMQPTSGSGLGLAIVRQIIEAHQGTVRAQNHPETGGAWVQVILPYERTS